MQQYDRHLHLFESIGIISRGQGSLLMYNNRSFLIYTISNISENHIKQNAMADKKVHLKDPLSNKEIKLPVMEATSGANIIDIRSIYKHLGCFTFDPGFVSTASCESKITYIDGDAGLLYYRGYPIEQLAEKSNYLEVCYLLLYGELPNADSLQNFNASLTEHANLDLKKITALLESFDRSEHPMAMLMAALCQLAAMYHDELAIQDAAYRERSAHRLVAKVAAIAACILRYKQGKTFKTPNSKLSYTERFLDMALDDFNPQSSLSQKYAKAMDLILLLHADHEQNASTSTVRLSGSTETNPYAALVAGIASLWGPAHGGANEAVIDMLENIVESGQPLQSYIDRAKDKNSHFRLMGFGHRIYKNYDPRAKIIRTICHELLSEIDKDDINKPLLDTAKELENIALKDDYFISRKLYPNVDFYSGIIFNAMGLPRDMYTVIFALARTIGWISHWDEMLCDPLTRIGRPRQLYTGYPRRDYTPIQQR